MNYLKKSKLIALTLSLLLFSSFIISSANAASKNLVINTDNIILGKVYYSDFSMMAKKITSPDGIGYCLEIDKNYPHGESFTHSGTVSPEIINILSCGYPNKSPSDLNLISEDDAYFATQIAIWSIIEGYDVSKITGNNLEVIAAINTIYNNSLNITNANLNYNTNLFFTIDSVQNVVVLSGKDQIPPIQPDIPTKPDVIPTPPSIDESPIINGK